MLHNVNEQAVHQILRHLSSVVGQGQYNASDVLIGISEFLGRIIVDMAETPVSGIQMAQVMEQHIKRTLQAGYTAKGYSMGPMEL